MIFKLLAKLTGYYIHIEDTPYYPRTITFTKKGYERDV